VETLAVKVTIGFFLGIVLCVLLLVGMQAVMPIWAQTDNLSSSSDNLGLSLIELLPDFEKIYREALITPLQEARKKIYDDDVARFYQILLEKSDLDMVEDETP